MSYENLLLEVQDGIATLSFNRPKALNALNSATLGELQKAVKELEQNAEVKVILMTGVGEKAFIAGADIVEMQNMNSVQALEFGRLGQSTMALLENIKKPVIAVVNGFALGGGCEMALSADFIIASEKAKFGLPEVTLGVIPGFGGTQKLARAIGKARAKELIFTGNMITALEAYELGLVNHVYPAETLLEEAKKIAATIAKRGQLAVGMGKWVVNSGYDLDLEKGNIIEANAFGVLFDSEDKKEGMTAFVEKRKPNFIGK